MKWYVMVLNRMMYMLLVYWLARVKYYNRMYMFWARLSSLNCFINNYSVCLCRFVF